MERKVYSTANYVQSVGEVNNGEVVTVPDMSIPLRDILLRHTRGQAVPVTGIPVYDETIYEDPKRMDLVDLQERRAQLNERKRQISDVIKKEREEKAKQIQDEKENPRPESSTE